MGGLCRNDGVGHWSGSLCGRTSRKDPIARPVTYIDFVGAPVVQTLLDRVADLHLYGVQSFLLIQPGEDVALGPVVVHEPLIFFRHPRVLRMPGFPLAQEDHAAQPDLHQLLEAVETGLESGVENGAVDRGAEARGGGHRVLLGVDAEADVVELACELLVRSLNPEGAAAAATFRFRAVWIAGRGPVVATPKDSVVADDHRAHV